ncbi:hypothetical protein [Streptomyces sp. NPDC096142]|uniref:hypothetical protein n=1 Tax=Streptomyces sp. NPDC096142 TaxID=3366077 RepID=UPI00382997F8
MNLAFLPNERIASMNFLFENECMKKHKLRLVTVGRLHLMAQYHDGTRITWQSLAEAPLKGVDLDDEAFIDSLLDAE